MSDHLKPESRFSDPEISLLFQRALERQEAAEESASRPASPRPGLSLSALEQIAREVGIEARHLRAAAAEMEVPHPDPKNSSLIVSFQPAYRAG